MCEQFAELGVCYGDALWRDSAGAGLVTTRFVVQSDGRVDEACFLDTAINDREMLECIRERFLEIEVAEIDKTTTVVFPIDYQFLRPATSSQKPSKCERLRRDDAEADEP